MSNITIKTNGFSGYPEIHCHDCENLRKQVESMRQENQELKELLKEHIALESQRSMPIREHEERSRRLLEKARQVIGGQ